MTIESEQPTTPPAAPSTPMDDLPTSVCEDTSRVVVSDRTVRAVVWISGLILLLPIIIFLYVYYVRNRLLKG